MESEKLKCPDMRGDFEREGYAVLPHVVGEIEVAKLIEVLAAKIGDNFSAREEGRENYAMRNLLENVPAVHDLAKSQAIMEMVQRVLGIGAFPVRGLFFDKTPEANWKVAWHQDLTIAVKDRLEILGYGPWSVKAGIQHVQPPVAIMKRMLAVRLHLDDCGEENGPLQVLPGSHRAGRLSAEEIHKWRAQARVVECTVDCGGVVLMRPLLLHASSSARKPGHRRVIHLEYAAENLPGGLEWLTS